MRRWAIGLGLVTVLMLVAAVVVAVDWRALSNPYTIFVVSGLIIAGWLAGFALFTVRR